MTGRGGRWGAYGLHLEPVLDPRWLVAAPPDWQTVSLASVAPRPAPTGAADVTVHADGPRVRLDTGAGWRLLLDLDAATATYRGIGLSDPELVHPGLAAAAAILSRAWGRAALHAGGFVLGGRAWGVLGSREAGKTTLLGELAGRGLGIVADDLLVVDDDRVYAGPRCLDLRDRPAGRLPVTRVRDGMRHRLSLPAVPSDLPLAGWVLLDWGDEVAVEPSPPGDRLRALAASASWLIGEQDPEQLLAMATLPIWRLTRPRRRDALDETSRALLEALTPAAVAG